MFKEKQTQGFVPEQAVSDLRGRMGDATKPIQTYWKDIYKFTDVNGTAWQVAHNDPAILVSTNGEERTISEFGRYGNLLHHVKGTIVQHEGETGHDGATRVTFIPGETHTGWQDAAKEIAGHIEELKTAVQSTPNLTQNKR